MLTLEEIFLPGKVVLYRNHHRTLDKRHPLHQLLPIKKVKELFYYQV